MPEDPNQIKVNVVLSGQHATSVKPLSSDQNVNVTLSGQDVSLTHVGETDATIALPGVQGPPGSDITAGGPDGAVQYNDDGVERGADTFFYKKGTDTVLVSGGALIVDQGDFVISGNPLSPNTFAVKDGSKNIIQVVPANNTENGKIILSQNTGPTEYFIGLGTDQAQEKLHLKNGNMRVAGDFIASGNIVPKEGGKFDLGSATSSWKDLYLDGDSIIFETEESKISVEKGRFSFFSKDDQGAEDEMFFAQRFTDTLGNESTLLSGITIADAVVSGTFYGTATRTGEAFLTASLPQGASNVFLAFGNNIDYTPKVVCTLVVPQGSEEMYYFVVENVTTAGANVVLSDSINQAGYSIDCFVSPKE